jgi:superfamily II DNA or RNA helicase
MMDDQLWITRQALAVKRYACWSGCGGGKTYIGLEFARQVAHITEKKVLITTVPAVVHQWSDEARTFYGDELKLYRIKSRADMMRWMSSPGPGIGITNYEKWNPEKGKPDDEMVSEAKYLGGLILDESSRLRPGQGGKQCKSLTASSKGIEYKLSLTATPAPNEAMEFAAQAAFLEKVRTYREVLGAYFRRDESSHRWQLRTHARGAFYRFMTNWSVFIRDPRRYGWRQDLPDVPEPIMKIHHVDITPEQREELLNLSNTETGQRMLIPVVNANAIQQMKMAQVARGFRYLNTPKEDRAEKMSSYKGNFIRVPSNKPAATADIVKADLDDGCSVLVWTAFEAEVEILAEQLRSRGVSYEILTGATKPSDRQRMVSDVQSGKLKCLITRPQILAWGVNLQRVSSMVFHGFTNSFEMYYQAVRRAYRFGQTERLRIHVPMVKELEGKTWQSLERKARQDDEAVSQMEMCWRDYLKA